jgi:hypothetical protein
MQQAQLARARARGQAPSEFDQHHGDGDQVAAATTAQPASLPPWANLDVVKATNRLLMEPDVTLGIDGARPADLRAMQRRAERAGRDPSASPLERETARAWACAWKRAWKLTLELVHVLQLRSAPQARPRASRSRRPRRTRHGTRAGPDADPDAHLTAAAARGERAADAA